MRTFAAGQRWSAPVDVRDSTGIVKSVLDGPQHGAALCVIGARRSGKTWTLRAVQDALDHPRSTGVAPTPTVFADLRDEPLAKVAVASGAVLLLDEPGGAIRNDARAFLAELDDLRRNHRVHTLLCVTPREWVSLLGAGHGSAGVDERDSARLGPLDPAQSEKLARTADAEALLTAVPEPWRRHPYLLELLFATAESTGIWDPSRIDQVLRQAADTAADPPHRYLEAACDDGLDDLQQSVLREAAWGRDSLDLDAHAGLRSRGDRDAARRAREEQRKLLTQCGMLECRGGSWTISDPILAAAFPPPVRIHHVSDVHAGPKSAERVDVKDDGRITATLGRAAGAGPVRDAYAEHVESLAKGARAPHMIIVSGDLTEWCLPNEIADAKAWLDRVGRSVAKHPHLDAAEPTVLVVGGNHDVEWNRTGPGHAAGARHEAFATAFAARRCPALHRPPADREVACIVHERAELEVLLLGSSELGGEHADPLAETVEAERRAEAEAVAAGKPPPASVPRRIDPGLVHHAELRRAKEYRWRMPVRIAVLHHPVSPLPTTEVAPYAGLLNAGDVKSVLLDREFCLVLHGHAHTGWFGCEQWPGRHGDRTLRIASAPSLGSRLVNEQQGFHEIEIRQNRRPVPASTSVFAFGSPFAPGSADASDRAEASSHGLRANHEAVHEVVVRRFVRDGTTWRLDATMGPFEPGR